MKGHIYMELENIKKNVSLSEQAFKIIKAAITSNELKPGDVLTEEKLSEQLSISRTPIRSALQKLVFNGLAVTTSNKSIIVANVTQEDIENITVVRRSLEMLVIRLLKDHISSESINSLREICNDEREIINSKNIDYPDVVDMDYKFHVALAKITQNPFLVETIERAKFISCRFLILSGTMDKYGPRSVEEHSIIIDYIENGQFEFAEIAMKNHIDEISARILVND